MIEGVSLSGDVGVYYEVGCYRGVGLKGEEGEYVKGELD